MPLFVHPLVIIAVVAAGYSQCESGDIMMITAPNSGNIASLTTKTSGCGDADSPYLLEAPSGQAIEFTLIDFPFSEGDQPETDVCLVYANIKVNFKPHHNVYQLNVLVHTIRILHTLIKTCTHI